MSVEGDRLYKLFVMYVDVPVHYYLLSFGIEQLRIENERLRQQSVVLNTRLKHMQQMQDLTNMLQESHRYAVKGLY